MCCRPAADAAHVIGRSDSPEAPEFSNLLRLVLCTQPLPGSCKNVGDVRSPVRRGFAGKMPATRYKLCTFAGVGFTSGVAMLHIKTVQSLELPELTLYLTLRRLDEHERAGVLVAANIKVVRRLLASRFSVVSALLTPAWLERLEPQLRAREEEISVYVAERPLLEKITGYQMHQGALAVARIPSQPSFESLMESSPRPLLLAAVEGIASAENLGAVVRSCAAFGVHFLIVSETCGSPFQRRAVSGSMGTIFEQPVVHVDNLVENLTALRAQGVKCLAAHPRPGSKKLATVDLRGDCCLVFGAEGPGLTEAALAACEDAVEIPMPSHMNSLNVASATSVFLYEATRHRDRTLPGSL